MDLLGAAFASLAATCAPQVHPMTLAAIVRQESAGNPLAIGVNAQHASNAERVELTRLSRSARSAQEAAQLARRLLGAGYSLDLGLAQINSANLQRLGLDLRSAFEPCANLAAAAKLLEADYRRAHSIESDPSRALLATLSAYNTGSFTRGLQNGYVQAVLAKAEHYVVPALPLETSARHRGAGAVSTPFRIAARSDARSTPSFDDDARATVGVFAVTQEVSAIFVFETARAIPASPSLSLGGRP